MICNPNTRRLTLGEARKNPLLRREEGKLVDLSSIHRWAFRGVRGVKLGVTRVGGRIYTTERDIENFINQLNTTTDFGAYQKKQDIRAARLRLEQEGVLPDSGERD